MWDREQGDPVLHLNDRVWFSAEDIHNSFFPFLTSIHGIMPKKLNFTRLWFSSWLYSVISDSETLQTFTNHYNMDQRIRILSFLKLSYISLRDLLNTRMKNRLDVIITKNSMPRLSSDLYLTHSQLFHPQPMGDIRLISLWQKWSDNLNRFDKNLIKFQLWRVARSDLIKKKKTIRHRLERWRNSKTNFQVIKVQLEMGAWQSGHRKIKRRRIQRKCRPPGCRNVCKANTARIDHEVLVKRLEELENDGEESESAVEVFE